MLALPIQQHDRAAPAFDLILKRSRQNVEHMGERRASGELLEKSPLALEHVLYALTLARITAIVLLGWQIGTRLLKLGDARA
jgi:hypothetical protein